MAEAWRSAPVVSSGAASSSSMAPPGEFAETSGGAATGRAAPKRKPLEQKPETFQDAWKSAPIVEPSFDEKARAFSQGAVGGMTEAGGVVAGVAAGGKFGALGGPASPWTVPIGMAIGAGAGYIAGRQARQGLSGVDFMGQPVTQPVESMSPAVRPYGYAGEVVGGAAPITAGITAAGASGLRSGGTYIDWILEFVGKNPWNALAAESAAAGGAGVAAAVSESYLPGQAVPRAAAEVAGGFFNPSRLLIGASRGAADTVRMAIGSMTQAGREGRAAKVLQDIVTQSGEDPIALAKALREANLPGVNVTAAQKTGSPALIAMEAKLSRESAKFGADSRRMADEGLAAIQTMIVALKGSGDPSALRAAAELQDRYFRTVITGRIQIAERGAVEAAGRITRDTPQAYALLSRQSNELLDESMREVRTVESQLWSAVPQNIRMTPDSIIAGHTRIRNGLLPEEAMPPVIEGFVQRMRDTGATTSGELILFRSRALALARESGAQGRSNDARIFGALAESALDDLSRIGGRIVQDDMFAATGTQRGMLQEPGADELLTQARSFSRQLNDTFTRTFAGDAMATRSTGADRIPPELMLRRALGAGREAGEVRMRELEEAMKFLPERGLGGPEAQNNFAFMMDAQERILRLSAAEAIDPSTQRVSATRLSRFIDNNATLLDRFPEVRKTLQDAIKSETGAQQVEEMATGAKRAVERVAAFSKVLKTDSASDAVKKALAGDNPESQIVSLARLAKGRGGGANAVEGLKVAIWDDAIRRSLNADGTTVSFEKLNAALFTELRPGLPPLANILQKEGVITVGDIAKSQEFIKRAQTIQSALERGTGLEQLMQSPDAAFDLVLRIAGARLGTAIHSAGPGGAGGGSIIAASRGSSFARQVFEKVPQARIKDVLISAATDPRFAAMLLEKPQTPAQGIRLARQIHAYFLQVGITGQDE